MKFLRKMFGFFSDRTASSVRVPIADDSVPDLQRSVWMEDEVCKSGAESFEMTNPTLPVADDVPCSEERGEQEKMKPFDSFKPMPEQSRFEQRLERAMHPRRRRHNKKHVPVFVRPTSHLAAVIEDLETSPTRIGGLSSGPCYSHSDSVSPFEALGRVGCVLACAAIQDGVEPIKRKIKVRLEKETREAHLAKRRKYYDAEREKRHQASAKIKASVPSPENAMPAAEQLLDAYRHRHDNEAAALRFGRLMIDLDEYVRYTVTRTDATGRISGNEGGVREWLKRNCPELAAHYHTCLRFKRKVQDDPLRIDG